MADVQAPGVWATYHPMREIGDLEPRRLCVLEVVNRDQDDPSPDYVHVVTEAGLQYAMDIGDGWWADAEGTLPAALPTSPPES